MPRIYVTYRDQTNTPCTVPVETGLSFRVFRAAALVEGVELPGGRLAVMPSAILMLSLDPPPPPFAAPASAPDPGAVANGAKPSAGAIAEGAAAARRKGR